MFSFISGRLVLRVSIGMFFSLINLNLTGIQVGPTVSGAYYVGGGSPDTVKPADLVIPRQGLQSNPSIFAMLGWHAGLSDFVGRDEDVKQLREWADSEPRVSLKFITGAGGVGKSRLAAEFAEIMQDDGWAAGFVDLRNPSGYWIHETGTLLVVDYPEENREGVTDLLRNLSNLPVSHPLFRVLFLSRFDVNEWGELIRDSGADAIKDEVPLHLSTAPIENAYAILLTAQKRAADALESEPYPLTEAAFDAWQQLSPEHARPLYIVAAAVHDAVYPGATFKYTGAKILEELVERELSRLRRIEQQVVIQRHALARLVAIAAISDGLDHDDLRSLAAKKPLDLGLPDSDSIVDVIGQCEVMTAGRLPRPEPDLIAAAFLVRVLAERPELAPERLWAALEGDVGGGLERAGRLSYDAEVVLGLHEHRLSDWLASAFAGNPARCLRAAPIVAEVKLPVGLAPLDVAVWQSLAESTGDDAEKASRLNNLSVALNSIGDAAGALDAIRKAVEKYRRLAAANPARFEPELASSLNNLSNRLSDAGDAAGALDAIREAVEIYRRLAKASPARYEPDLARSLSVLSHRLEEQGQSEPAIKAAEEALRLIRPYADRYPESEHGHGYKVIQRDLARLTGKGE
ncbi:MAG: tetratricopeptide repeat protein [Proteobacteria bacterium]|nr:tetratricopeptide repeat protein [Pseudomonadota bacterium]